MTKQKPKNTKHQTENRKPKTTEAAEAAETKNYQPKGRWQQTTKAKQKLANKQGGSREKPSL